MAEAVEIVHPRTPEGRIPVDAALPPVISTNIAQVSGTAQTAADWTTYFSRLNVDLSTRAAAAQLPTTLTAAGNFKISLEETPIMAPVDLQAQYSTILDSTTAPLGANATYTGTAKATDRYARITGIVYADVAGTVYIDQSSDGVNWDYVSSFSVSAGVGLAYSVEVVGSHCRLRYTNGPTAQTVFRCYMRGRVI